MRIALLGTDGLPARYGGFETCVEHLAPILSKLGHEVVVIGSCVGRREKMTEYRGVCVRYINMRANGLSSIIYDGLSLARALRSAEVAVLFGVSGGGWIPFLRLAKRNFKIIVNVDGLDSQRSKWGMLTRRIIAASEFLAVNYADAIVSDNKFIGVRVFSRYRRESKVIAYGNDHVRFLREAESRRIVDALTGWSDRAFCLTIARAEPENMLLEMIEGFRASSAESYVLVSNFQATAYGSRLKELFRKDGRIKLIDAVYDADVLAALRQECSAYLHGHSVGGTNPSLIEMLPYSKPIIAYDCDYNRWSLDNGGAYFLSSNDLAKTLDDPNREQFVPRCSVELQKRYSWVEIAEQYASIMREALA